MARARKATGPVLGLDVGTTFIKVAEVRPSKEGVQINAVGMAPTPEGVIDESGYVQDPQTLGQAIRQLMSQAGISTRQVVTSIPGQSALVVRVIEMPKMSPAELDKSMAWEVERHIPFAAQGDVVTDYAVVERPNADPNDPNMEVLLAAAQQDVVDAVVKALFAAQLDPVAIDVQVLATARTIIGLQPEKYRDKTVVLLNIGATATDMGVFQSGVLRLPRTIPIAGNHFTQAIVDSLAYRVEGTDPRERFAHAEKLKREYAAVLLERLGPTSSPTFGAGFGMPTGMVDFSQPSTPGPVDFSAGFGEPSFDVGEEQPAPPAQPTPPVPAEAEETDPLRIEVFEAIAPVLGDFLAEVRRSIEFYRGRVPGAQVDEIVLCGGTARMKNMDRFLTQELGIPVSVADPLTHQENLVRRYTMPYLQEVAPLMTVAIGLAVRDMID
ncbi:MAG: type IV pilus assembly protein PilM [Armatimonadota bacterium]|nr:type IV pilus assembly protein PilM [bacterium]MCS7308696.1 type IV pilus assembly protein PilM [Armatimonadota bacterium]MDW8104506.1 type IV pilus assembly protein PilM [Armatimonadota bacterium]MDW8289191.1 type IV pilus assembly protein PilM [Armatimonadota bacterium]